MAYCYIVSVRQFIVFFHLLSTPDCSYKIDISRCTVLYCCCCCKMKSQWNLEDHFQAVEPNYVSPGGHVVFALLCPQYHTMSIYEAWTLSFLKYLFPFLYNEVQRETCGFFFHKKTHLILQLYFNDQFSLNCRKNKIKSGTIKQYLNIRIIFSDLTLLIALAKDLNFIIWIIFRIWSAKQTFGGNFQPFNELCPMPGVNLWNRLKHCDQDSDKNSLNICFKKFSLCFDFCYNSICFNFCFDLCIFVDWKCLRTSLLHSFRMKILNVLSGVFLLSDKYWNGRK